MTEVWTGHIVIEGLSNKLEDVHLWNTTTNGTNVLPVNASLHFLSNVHVPSIPLYTLNAPPLELSTDNTTTAAWLSDRLNVGGNSVHRDSGGDSPASWWFNASKQLDIGILLGVNCSRGEGTATEILLYAEVERSQQDFPKSHCPSPIILPENTLQNADAAASVTAKVFALPLCSDILTQTLKTTESARADQVTRVAPTSIWEDHAANPSIQKRRRMSDLFEDATQQRRKLKGRGGEAVSKALVEADHTISQQGPTSLLSREENVAVPKGAQKHVLKASNVAVLTEAAEMRPVSRDEIANGKSSSSRPAESAPSPRQHSILLDGESEFTLQNKTALTKMVMAGMRLHGLQQKKNRASFSRRTSSLNDSALSGFDSLNDGDDDYKRIYHHTFRATIFTFRAYFSNRLLGQDVMRDVVDRLLLLFCADPLSSIDHEDPFVQAPGSTPQEKPTHFDLPSGVAHVETPVGQAWSTPLTKKRR